MPEKSASLACSGEVVHIALASLYGTLCYICWPISPPSLNLSNAMPVLKKFSLLLLDLKFQQKLLEILIIYIYIYKAGKYVTSGWRYCCGHG